MRFGVATLALVFAWGCSGDSSDSGDRVRNGRAPAPAAAATGPEEPADPGRDFGNGSGQTAEQIEEQKDDDTPTTAADACADCILLEAGPGGSLFDLDNNPNEGVGLDPDGAIVLQRDDPAGEPLIWIANTREYTVSKFNTETREELGRYRVALDETKSPAENGPSRTTTDSDGNLYVGARMGDHVSKVSAAGADCPDTNGDGVVSTSGGPGEVLGLGEDDCLLWTTDIGGDARGLALQEIPATFTIEPVPDGEPIITETPAERYLWVGGHQSKLLHKLDAETGEVLFTINAPTSVYGLALDGRGNLWISGRGGSLDPLQAAPALGRVDTTRCLDASCGNETVCTTACTVGSCPDACDSAVLERVEMPGGPRPYGVTVDCNQRVWVAGSGGTTQGVWRYDPLATPADRLAASTVTSRVNGLAADANGFVWAAGKGNGLYRVDADALTSTVVVGTTPAEAGSIEGPKGVAVDKAGMVWAVALRDDHALVVDPGAGLHDAAVAARVQGLGEPYTYSDMTGEQTRLAANEPGSYRQLFEGCEKDGATIWHELDWDVDVPSGTTVLFMGRSAETLDELEQASWFSLAGLPGRDAPLDVDPFTAGDSGKYFEIEVRLVSTVTATESKDGCEFSDALSPRVNRFSLSYDCDQDVE